MMGWSGWCYSCILSIGFQKGYLLLCSLWYEVLFPQIELGNLFYNSWSLYFSILRILNRILIWCLLWIKIEMSLCPFMPWVRNMFVLIFFYYSARPILEVKKAPYSSCWHRVIDYIMALVISPLSILMAIPTFLTCRWSFGRKLLYLLHAR